MIGQHPGARGTHGIKRDQRIGDDVAEAVYIQSGVQVREVEGLVHFVGTNPLGQPGERVHVGFGAQNAVRSVLFQDGTPAAVDLVQGRLAEHRSVLARETI